MDVYRPDYVVNGETGYLVKSEADISHALAALLSDRDLRLKMSAAAARHASQFEWNKVARDWENAFLEAVTKRCMRH
jgi:glycosyltransferase involved in cell wall biosynthesis